MVFGGIEWDGWENGALKDILAGWTAGLPYSASEGGSERQNDKVGYDSGNLGGLAEKVGCGVEGRGIQERMRDDKNRNTSSLKQCETIIYEARADEMRYG